ncbi:MAG: sodium:solute symporter family protein [Verrucomicrobiae bacterium]|nr:sodium:solute symporter family protein [Verrucomicrobiae bacterium]
MSFSLSLIGQAEVSSQLGGVAIVVLVIYLVMLLTLGVVAWRRGRTTEEDYYLAGRSQGFIVTVMTIMATFFSSAAILGVPGNVYKEGVAFMLFALNLPCAGACIYLFGARIRRIGQKRGYVTQGDMIADYYGDSAGLRMLVAVVGFLYVLPYVIMQIKAGGHLAQGLFPGAAEAFEQGAMALSLVTIIYVLIGGMRSVAWTDVLQGFLLIAGMLIAAVATIVTLGGFGGFFEKVREIDPQGLALPGPSGVYSPWKMLTICVFASIGSLVQPAQWMRLYAAKSDRVLKRSALVFSIVLPACFLFGIMLVALAGRALYPPEMIDGVLTAHPHVGEFDQIVVVMVKEQLPQMLGLFGVVLVAILLVAVLAASMSTADSNLHALSAVVTRDVYDRFVRPSASENERAWVGRFTIIGATLLALWMVRAGHENADFAPLKMIVNLMFAAIGFSCQLLPVTLDMLFIRRGTRAGIMAGMIAGIAVVFLFTPFPDLLFGRDGATPVADSVAPLRSLFDIGFTGFVVNAAVFALVSAFTRRLDPERTKKLALDMDVSSPE